MTSQAAKQIMTIHILLIMSRNEDNETKKFGQLKENNMEITFLEKSYTKRG